MDLANILKEMSSEIRKSPEELMNSNIDEIFQKGSAREGGYFECMCNLMKYIKKECEPGYNLFFDNRPYYDGEEPDSLPEGKVNLNLTRHLKSELYVKDELYIIEKHILTTKILTFDFETVVIDEENKICRAYNEYPKTFFEERNIGKILKKIKKIYDLLKNDEELRK